MGLSGTAVVLLTSLLAIPISYGVNLIPQLAENPLGIFLIGVLTLLIIFVIPYHFGRDKKRRKDSMYFVWSIFTFASVIDFVIALENDGVVHNFMVFYMLGGEPYLKSAHGTMINYFDGIFHFAMYLLILSAIDHLQSYRDVGLYWSGSIINSVIVLCFGSVIGKYGVRWSVLLNVPYVTLPIWVAYRLLTRPRVVKVKSEDTKETKSAGSTSVNIFFIVYFVFAIIVYTFNASAALDCKAGIVERYLKDFVPYLKDPIAFPKVQMLVYFFYYIPFCVFAIHSLMFSSVSQWLYDWSLIHAGAAANAHGCYILDIVHKNALCGLPVVKNAMNRILYTCHGVLYKQLCSWLLHGCLSDPYNEFFIQHSTDETSDTSMTVVDEDDELPIMGVTGRQLQKVLSTTLSESNRRQNRFTLKADLLPVYIPVRVANKILFVGESIQMFENDKKPKAHKKGSILKNREEEFAKVLHQLSLEEEYHAMSFEAFIDQIRTHVAEHLWILVIEDSDLVGYLKIIKDFFLLGRGELFLAFIDQAQSLLRGPPGSTTEHDVNMAFQQAARNVLIDDENLLQRFHLNVTTKATEKKTDTTSGQTGLIEPGWNCLGLSYTVQWPLHIFFTPSVLKKYNHVFCFLLAVKRAQIDIQQCWTLQMQHKQKPSSPEEVAKWQLRTHMAFLVDNLQYYLQVDVIESQYSTLIEKITSTRDFEAVQLAHDQFLSALLSQSFVHMKAVSKCLHEILDQCAAFCKLLTQCDSPMGPREISHLESIAKNFQRQSNLLFKILSSVRSHNTSHHLAQLLLRLDFNRYFSIAGGQLGSY